MEVEIKDDKFVCNVEGHYYVWHYISMSAKTLLFTDTFTNVQKWLGHGVYCIYVYDIDNHLIKHLEINTITVGIIVGTMTKSDKTIKSCCG